MAATVKTRRIEAELRKGEKVTIPAWLLESGKPGPGLLLVAAQHGNEVQGSETIRRFVELAKTKLRRGKVFAVPMANLPAIRERRPHIRMKAEQPYGDARGHNMNTTWPGARNGNATARLPFAIHQAFNHVATHVFDLHTWEKHKAPALIMRDVPGLRDLAGLLGHRFVEVRPPTDRTLSGYFCATGRIGITFEFAGQYDIDEEQVKRGLRLVTNMAKAIGVIGGKLAKRDDPVLFSDECEVRDVTARCSGLFVESGLKNCDLVRKGDLLGHILSDIDLKRHEVHAPADGYLRVYGVSRPNSDVALPALHPYVTKGDLLARVQFKTK